MCPDPQVTASTRVLSASKSAILLSSVRVDVLMNCASVESLKAPFEFAQSRYPPAGSSIIMPASAEKLLREAPVAVLSVLVFFRSCHPVRSIGASVVLWSSMKSSFVCPVPPDVCASLITTRGSVSACAASISEMDVNREKSMSSMRMRKEFMRVSVCVCMFSVKNMV